MAEAPTNPARGFQQLGESANLRVNKLSESVDTKGKASNMALFYMFCPIYAQTLQIHMILLVATSGGYKPQSCV